MSILSLFSRPLPRLLLVAGAVGVTGVTIDLVQGSPANALTGPGAGGSALAALPIDHSVVKNSADDDSLQPGASVAAYDASIDTSVARVPALAVKSPINDDALEPGASVAAYGS